MDRQLHNSNDCQFNISLCSRMNAGNWPAGVRGGKVIAA